MNKKVFSALAIAGVLNFCIAAQNQAKNDGAVQSLTIDSAVELAIKNNISVKQSKLQLDLLEKQNKSSWNSVSPSISLGGGITDSLPVTEGAENSLSYSVSASASMRFTPSLFTTMKAAKLSYEKGEISYENAKRSVEMSVRQSFYSLINMKESIETNKKALDAAKRTYDSNLAKYNRGQLDQLSLMTSQYNYERQIPSVQNAENSYQISMDTFKQVLGIKLDQEVVLVGSLDDILKVNLDEEDLIVNLDNLPSVKEIQRNIESTENSLQAARFSAYGPSVSGSFNYSTGDSIPSSDFGSSTRATVGLNVSIPLDGYLPWSNGALSIASQKTNLENYKLQLENAKTTAAINIKNGANTLNSAQAQLKIYESNVELMQRTYDMTLIAYNNGSKDWNSLQTAEDNLASARYSLQSQKYTIINAVLSLENIMGLEFGTLNKK